MGRRAVQERTVVSFVFWIAVFFQSTSKYDGFGIPSPTLLTFSLAECLPKHLNMVEIEVLAGINIEISSQIEKLLPRLT